MPAIASIDSMLNSNDPLNVIFLTLIACAIATVFFVGLALISNVIVGMRERKQERKLARTAAIEQGRAKVKEKITAGQERLASHQEKLTTLAPSKEERERQTNTLGG